MEKIRIGYGVGMEWYKTNTCSEVGQYPIIALFSSFGPFSFTIM